jgi:protein TonB
MQTYTASKRYQSGSSKYVGIGVVVFLHIAIVYALYSALQQRAKELIPPPIQVKNIDQVKPKDEAPPPPPPDIKMPPPPPYIPPPDIAVEAAPAATNAITTTSVKPVVAPPPPAAPPAPVTHTTVEPVFDKAHSREPEYPSVSRRLGEEGVVVVRVLVAEDGHVLQAELVKSSGFSRLDNAAVESMKSYRFGPGTVDGKPAQLWKTMQYRFQLT